jgi:5-methylcytosine-specific restriction protein A
MARKSFNRKDRARIFNAAMGVCHICLGKIGVGEAWEVEHIIPYALTQDNSDGNLAPAHVKCHRVKSADDATNLAKAERRRAKHNGSWPKSKAKMPSRPFSKTRQIP